MTNVIKYFTIRKILSILVVERKKEMENSMWITLITSTLVLVLWGVLKAFHSLWWKPKSLEKHLKQQGVKGTPYKLMYGDSKEYMKLMTRAWAKPMTLTHQIPSRVIPFADHIVRTYGKISMLWFGTTPRLIILDPVLMREVLNEKSGHFQKPSVNSQILILSRGLTTLEGEKWSKHRRIINPAFHLEKLKGMVPAFSTSCNEMIEEWNKLVSPQGSCELDLWPDLENLTGSVISRTAFGSNYKEGKRLFELQKEQMVLVVEAMYSSGSYIPGFSDLPTKKNRRRKYLDKEIKAILRELIQKKEQLMEAGESDCGDLLSLLLQSNIQNIQENGLTIEDVIEECKLFYLTGHETTSTLLTWTMIVLAMHPSWQEKARDEVFRICGKNSPKFEELNHLNIVTMILHEVLRLYPPVVELYRHTYKKTKLGEMTLPAGVDITLPILLAHHDLELWGDDAEEFKPERFAEGVSKASPKDETAFFPFGWGHKICIGLHFALIEAKMALAMILQNYSFELSPSYTHAPYTVMTLQPQHGAQIILHQL